MKLPECDGFCCKTGNPYGTCFHRHHCEFHAAETVATLNHRTMYRDPTGNLAVERADRTRKKKRP